MNYFSSTEPSDERLVTETLAGDDEAFVRLVRRYKQRVFQQAARFARDGDDLEDICQDVFIKIYETLGKFRGEAPFEHWFGRISVRVCYDALRSRKKEKQHVPLDAIHYEIGDDAGGERLAAEQAREILEVGLVRLQADERLVITLLELEEGSVREVSALTGWSETNVKVRAFRARQKLKNFLERQHER